MMRIALVAGIDRYPADLLPLTNAVSDAQAMADLLAREYRFELWPAGSPLLNEAATLTALRDAIQGALATGADQWLFYFAGHGDVVGGAGYLVPVDARRGEVATYLALAGLLADCRAGNLDQIAIVLDACYSGRALVRGETLDDMSPTAETRRVRQILSAGNPRQPVLDGGAGGHSVFTQSLLDALEGRAGVHEADGTVRFPRLLDHVVFDVPGRLRAAGCGADRQQPIGGHFQGNSERRTFDLAAFVPRLPPDLVRDVRSEDPARRREGLRLLVRAAREQPALTGPAMDLGIRHLRPETAQAAAWATRDIALRQTPPLVGRTLRYEPAAAVRAQAAATLGNLGDPRAVDPLLLALDDEPSVCRAAATALGQLGERRAVQPLLRRLRDPAREAVYLDLVAALGVLGDEEGLLEVLRESRRRNRLVPFVGPDFPQALTGLPDRAQVAQGLAEEHGLSVDGALSAAAQGTMLGASRHGFTAYMKRALDDQLLEPQAIYQGLARLGVPFWLSAAYDGQLVRALGAGTNDIVTGSDTRYWQSGRPTVVRLLGDLAANRDVVVLEDDYERLRQQEGERLLLLAFLREHLAGQVVLFMGHDPASPDWALLTRHVLGRYLAGVDVQAFLVWPGDDAPQHTWADRPIHQIHHEHQAFVEALAQDV